MRVALCTQAVDRVIAGGLAVLLLIAPLSAVAQQNPGTRETQALQTQQVDRTNVATADTAALPDSPSASSQQQAPQPSTTPSSQPQQAPQPATTPSTASSQQGTGKTQPVGTAAAGIENTAGIAASKPAGVALAPPKQHRVRMLVIKLGAIAGAGAALGSVIALSKASPSKPPGSH